MKKTSMLFAGLALAMLTIGGSCGGGPEVQPEEPVAMEAPDTTTMPEVVEQDPVEEMLPPLEEEQFHTVYFDFDKYNLRNDARVALDHNYDLLREYPNAMIRIEGHCDERGTVEYNISLGQKRAEATKDYLVGLGISEGRLSTRSYGKERPVDPRHNEEAWAKNRRCEFKVVSQ